MSNLKIKHLSALSSVIFATTLAFSANPANALTFKLGTNDANSFNIIKQIDDNGTDDIQNNNLDILEFKQSIIDPTRGWNFDVEGTLTANVVFDDFDPSVISNISLKLSQFTLKNKANTTLVSPTFRFEHLFNYSFTASDLAGFQLFDGSFSSPNNTNVASTTLANYRAFFLPSDSPGNTSHNTVESYQVSSGQIFTESSNFNFKKELPIFLMPSSVNNKIVVGEVTAVSLGAGETLYLPDSACMAIFNKSLFRFVNNGQVNFQPATNSCDPPESVSVSVPENSSGVGIIASAFLAAGFLINQRQKKSLSYK